MSVQTESALKSGHAARLMPVAMLVCAVLVLLNCYEWRNYYIDDAYIGFRCINNFIAGEGFFFNPGQQVESVTNIGWLLFVTPFACFWPAHIAGKIAGLVVALIAVFLVCLLGSMIDKAVSSETDKSYLGVMVPLLVFSEPAFEYFSLSGMETAFLSCVIALMALAADRIVLVALLAGLAFCIRPESIILFPLILCLRKATTETSRPFFSRPVFVAILAWAAVILFISAARIAYFGNVLPNTFYAKPSNALGFFVRLLKLCVGEKINVAFPFTCFFCFPVMIFGAATLQKKLPAIFSTFSAATLLGLFFAVYAPEDWTQMPRYFAPYLPFALFLLFAGLQALIELATADWKKWFRVLVTISFLVTLLFFRVEQLRLLRSDAREAYPGYVLTSELLLPAVTEMSEFIGEGEWVATRRIGLLGYSGKFRIFDYVYGLPDREVIEARFSHGRKFFEEPGDPGLRELWLKRRPGYILEDRSIIASPGSGSRLELNVHGIRYLEFKSYPLGKKESWVLLKADRQTGQ
ncbi:MAG TPA: hypothetical protein PKM56_07905 [Candidatus Rifleibacterium sp.]|nr:hypothetical protein [Candidatus Rifleibacterium sp.]